MEFQSHNILQVFAPTLSAFVIHFYDNILIFLSFTQKIEWKPSEKVVKGEIQSDLLEKLI